MSAVPQNPSSIQDPSPHSDGSADVRNADPTEAQAPLDQNIDIGSLIRAALVNGADATSATTAAGSGEHVYDGHVPLALDSDFLPAIDTTLDLLTTSTDLFDVPAIDFGSPMGDAADA